MALIKCSECGEKINNKAEMCPYCGASTQNTPIKYFILKSIKLIYASLAVGTLCFVLFFGLFIPDFCVPVQLKQFLAILIGFNVSLCGGHICTNIFIKYTRRGESTCMAEFSERQENELPTQVPGRLVGFIEGVFFTLFIALEPRSAAGIIPWIALKMATGWARVDKKPKDQGFMVWKHRAFSSMYGSLVKPPFSGPVVMRVFRFM